MASDSEYGRCCVLEDGKRCSKEAITSVFSKKLQKTAAQKKMSLAADVSAGHTRVCVFHRSTLSALKKQLEASSAANGGSKKKTKEHPAAVANGDQEINVDFSSLHIMALKRYRKHYKLNVANNSNKTELVAAIQHHFMSIPVNEGKDITSFLHFAHKKREQRQAAAIANL
eukprot:comp12417_c0_seq1/m.7322 comp12417_c0_seq1/g.7322  ORF comp12417_c0_seq1/g.7322 comp12417_c0_seq1/m.7322 type:complete len:171 (-) comp12417_c0_seq1:299-811(-)